MPKNDPLLQPLQLKHLTLKNRIVSTPHAPAYAEDGMPKLRYQLYHEEKAKGGLAMTMFGGSSCIGPDSPSVFGQLYVGDDRVIPYFEEFSERIHAHDCALVCQLSHLGRRTTWNAADWLPVIAPSRVREPAHRGFPKEMDQSDIDRVIGYYAAAALRCKQGGLDGCEILSHGHLLGQFLNPNTNVRNDKYGGSLENRLRFSIEVLAAVRRAVGDDFIVGLRAEMKSGSSDGLSLEEGLAALRLIESEGLIDYVSLNFGRIDTDHGLAHHLPAMWSRFGPWVALAGTFKKELGLPVIHACRIADLSTARYAIEENLIDLAGMTRAHIADPHIVRKLMAGEEQRIRPCVGAGYCIDRIYGEGEALCIHNAATGREADIPHVIPKSGGAKKKIVVVGGGPAGMEAARVSAQRGHDVVMFEATGRLGGQLVLAARATWRKDLIGIADWYATELETLGVDIRWNVLADEDTVTAESPDVVIVASGGVPDTDFVPGGEACVSVWDVLSGMELSGSVLLYDDNGQHQGPSCADHLAAQANVELEFVTPDRHAAAEMGGVNFPIYLERFYKNGVKVTPDHRLAAVTPQGNRLEVTFRNEYGGSDITRIVDHIVVEHGTLPVDDVFQGLRSRSSNSGTTDLDALLSHRPQPEVSAGEGFALYKVGDAVASRNLHAAIYDSLRLCKDL
ncbi:MAG: FAD-dependent oxidoreductase [Gammaproteobacteria bacterium]